MSSFSQLQKYIPQIPLLTILPFSASDGCGSQRHAGLLVLETHDFGHLSHVSVLFYFLLHFFSRVDISPSNSATTPTRVPTTTAFQIMNQLKPSPNMAIMIPTTKPIVAPPHTALGPRIKKTTIEIAAITVRTIHIDPPFLQLYLLSPLALSAIPPPFYNLLRHYFSY